MKLKRITPLIALVIAAILCFTSCSGSNRAAETETSGRLDLDYVENENAMQAEPEATERPWYAFITDAFSFGTANKGSTKAAAQPTSTPDSSQLDKPLQVWQRRRPAVPEANHRYVHQRHLRV